MIESVIELADERGSEQAQVRSAASAGFLGTCFPCAGDNIFSSRGLTAIKEINKFNPIEASLPCCRS
jgi:hypothetical protein